MDYTDRQFWHTLHNEPATLDPVLVEHWIDSKLAGVYDTAYGDGMQCRPYDNIYERRENA